MSMENHYDINNPRFRRAYAKMLAGLLTPLPPLLGESKGIIDVNGKPDVITHDVPDIGDPSKVRWFVKIQVGRRKRVFPFRHRTVKEGFCRVEICPDATRTSTQFLDIISYHKYDGIRKDSAREMFSVSGNFLTVRPNNPQISEMISRILDGELTDEDRKSIVEAQKILEEKWVGRQKAIKSARLEAKRREQEAMQKPEAPKKGLQPRL